LNASELDSPEVDDEGEHLNLWDGLLQASRREIDDVSRQLYQRLGSHERRWLETLAAHCTDSRTGQEAFQMALGDEWMEVRNGLEEWRKAAVDESRLAVEALREDLEGLRQTFNQKIQDLEISKAGFLEATAGLVEFRQQLVDRVAQEQNELAEELQLTLRSECEELRAWRRDAVDPALAQVVASQERLAALTETIQQMTPWANEMASRVESHGGGVIEVARRVQELAEKVELMEEIVGTLPPRQPLTPLGPLPVGGDLGAEAAELISRGNELRNVFLQRAAARGQAPGGQRPAADPRQVRPAL
jgi:hypothetical protein